MTCQKNSTVHDFRASTVLPPLRIVMQSNRGMKVIGEIRRERLAQLREELRGISFADMNERMGRNRRDATLSQVSQAAPNTRTGRARQIGDDQARDIETAFNKPHGWMDRDPEIDHLQAQLQASSGATDGAWPFGTIRPEQWQALSQQQRDAVEQLIASFAGPSKTVATGTRG